MEDVNQSRLCIYAIQLRSIQSTACDTICSQLLSLLFSKGFPCCTTVYGLYSLGAWGSLLCLTSAKASGQQKCLEARKYLLSVYTERRKVKKKK